MWEYTRLKAGLIDAYNEDEVINNIARESDDERQWQRQQQQQNWHLQSRFRAQFANTMDLPLPSDKDAWKAALTDCSKNDSSVIFSGQLSLKHKGSNVYNFTMFPLKMERSHRLQRRFGADRFMEITVSRTDMQEPEQFAKWIVGSIHYFLGRHWIPFFVKDATERRANASSSDDQKTRVDQKVRLYFFAAFGNEFRGSGEVAYESRNKFKPQPNITSSEFLRWALDVDDNSQQTVCKLFSRISLSEAHFGRQLSG